MIKYGKYTNGVLVGVLLLSRENKTMATLTKESLLTALEI